MTDNTPSSDDATQQIPKISAENTSAEKSADALPAQPTKQHKSRRFGGRRSPVSIGAMGIMILLMLALSSFYLTQLPLIGAGARYTAKFAEAAGLKEGNEVRVAGIKVGNVESVSLNGDKVDVKFRVSNTWIGDQTQASIQIKTVLGQKYLGLVPRGSTEADPDVPLTDTVSPYDVIQAFSDASNQIEDLDTDKVATSLATLSDAFSGTSGDMSASLKGISRLSQTIASRDQEVQKLLGATKNTSKILSDRNEEFTRLIAGAGQLLDELNNRQKSISALLTSTTTLSTALSGIVKENQAQIGPALASVREVASILTKQNTNLRKTIQNMAPFYRLYANVLGNGRWFESAVTNLLPPALPQQNTTRPPNMNKSGAAQQNNGGTAAG